MLAKSIRTCVGASLLVLGGVLSGAPGNPVREETRLLGVHSICSLPEFANWCRGRDWSKLGSDFEFADARGVSHLLGLSCWLLPDEADDNEICVGWMQGDLTARGNLKHARNRVRASVGTGIKPYFGPIACWLHYEWQNPADGCTYLVVVVGDALPAASVQTKE